MLGDAQAKRMAQQIKIRSFAPSLSNVLQHDKKRKSKHDTYATAATNFSSDKRARNWYYFSLLLPVRFAPKTNQKKRAEKK